MADNKRAIGTIGEDAVCEYLTKQGYEIKERNYYSRYGEIDIIALYDNCTAFIEVKSRSSERVARPCEAVNYSKQQHIIQTAQDYIQKNQPQTSFCFDVAEVFFKKTKNTYSVTGINYIKNAFTL